MVYTDRWNGFQFRPPTYLDGRIVKDQYDLVKWESHSPKEVIDAKTGKPKTVTEGCFSIGFLNWNKSEGWFEFESVGTRYFENHINGLDEWIMDFCNELYETKYKEQI